MALETGTYISDLNAANPVGATDLKSAGDDHLRLIKATILATFPNITGAVTLTHTQINNAVNLTGSNVNYLVFYQAAAPTGWTQNTALSNLDGSTLRVETGTGGGAVGGTHALESAPSTAHTHTVSGTSGSTTLTAAQSGLPTHSHYAFNSDETAVSLPTVTSTNYAARTNVTGGNPGYDISGTATVANVGATSPTGGTAASSGHTHTFSATSGAASSTTTFKPKYINVILCSKN